MFKKQLVYCPDLTLNCFHISMLPPCPCLQADRHLVNIVIKEQRHFDSIIPRTPLPGPK